MTATQTINAWIEETAKTYYAEDSAGVRSAPAWAAVGEHIREGYRAIVIKEMEKDAAKLVESCGICGERNRTVAGAIRHHRMHESARSERRAS